MRSSIDIDLDVSLLFIHNKYRQTSNLKQNLSLNICFAHQLYFLTERNGAINIGTKCSSLKYRKLC